MFGRNLYGRPRRIDLDDLSGDRAEACARLHADAFPHPWDAYDFERLIGASTGFGNAAIDGRTGALVGFILSRRAADEAEVLTVTVDAACRRRGIGGRLLEANIACLGRHGVKALFLEVAEDNAAARRLYQALGFAEVGRRQGYYRVPGDRAVAALTLRRSVG